MRCPSLVMEGANFKDFPANALRRRVAVKSPTPASVMEPLKWRHFYFHPTLNPFAVPRVLGFFLASVWAILILALACLDEVKHRLSLGDAILYLGGLMGVCAVDYIIFSLCTLYYVGYVLLVFYFWFAIHRFLRR